MTERTFWRRYRRNRAAVLGLALFALVVFTAIFGWLLYPSDPWAPVTRPFLWPGERTALAELKREILNNGPAKPYLKIDLLR